MQENKSSSTGIPISFVLGLILGGAAVALLTPKKGEEFREDMREKLHKVKKKTKSIDKQQLEDAIIDDNRPIL